MAYDPSDLRLPYWLLRVLDWLVRIRIPLGRRRRLGMTRPGVMLVAVLAGLWAAAIYSGNNLLYLCGSMLTALAAASLWQGIRLLDAVPAFKAHLPDFTVAGEPYVLRRAIADQSIRPAAVELQWQRRNMSSVAFQVRCGEPVRIGGTLKGEKRGVIDLDEQQLSTSAPLGLWRITLIRHEAAEWLVLPMPVAWSDYHGSGDRRSTPLEGEELRDLRGYIPGDALSRIHWRKAAFDMSRWSVKRFEQLDSARQHELLRVDLRSPVSGHSEAFEMLLGRAWHWIESRLQGKSGSFSVIIDQHLFDPLDEQQRSAMIRSLAGATPQNRAPAGEGGTLLSLVER